MENSRLFPGAVALFCSACSFAEPAAIEAESADSSSDDGASSGTAGNDGQEAASSSSFSDSGSTDPVGQSAGGSSGDSDGDGDGSGTSDSGDSGDETSRVDACEPVELAIEGEIAAGEMRSLYVDLDAMPGDPGSLAQMCVTFMSNNAASSRAISVDGVQFSVGPCGSAGPAPGPFAGCGEFLKDAGLVEVVIDNAPGPGCQSGSMEETVLTFGCIE